MWPSSPGAKLTAEQKPSEEVMRSVSPSLDLESVPSAPGQVYAERSLPCKVSERRKMQVADNADWRVLLGVVD